MGQVLHGSATTTEAVRRAIQHSQESLRALAKRHGVNPKTIAKWKSRKSVADLRTGPREPRSTVLTIEEEAVVAPSGGIPKGAERPPSMLRACQESTALMCGVEGAIV